jgi:hypothetical protein
VVAIVQLAGDEDLVSGQSGRGHCGADALLVAIHLRRVDVAVTGLERGQNGTFGLGGRDLEDAEPELGDIDAVVEPDRGYV